MLRGDVGRLVLPDVDDPGRDGERARRLQERPRIRDRAGCRRPRACRSPAPRSPARGRFASLAARVLAADPDADLSESHAGSGRVADAAAGRYHPRARTRRAPRRARRCNDSPVADHWSWMKRAPLILTAPRRSASCSPPARRSPSPTTARRAGSPTASRSAACPSAASPRPRRSPSSSAPSARAAQRPVRVTRRRASASSSRRAARRRRRRPARHGPRRLRARPLGQLAAAGLALAARRRGAARPAGRDRRRPRARSTASSAGSGAHVAREPVDAKVVMTVEKVGAEKEVPGRRLVKAGTT